MDAQKKNLLNSRDEVLAARLFAEIAQRLPTQRDPRAIPTMLDEFVDNALSMSGRAKSDLDNEAHIFSREKVRLRIQRSLNAEIADISAVEHQALHN